MEQYKHSLGFLGENIARSYFLRLGYCIIAKNARIGHKEIDLIIQKGLEVRFIEVKTSYLNKLNKRQFGAEDYISKRKINTLKQAIFEYCLILAKKEENFCLDFIAITVLKNKMANISYFKNIT